MTHDSSNRVNLYVNTRPVMSFVEGGIGTDTQAQLATADTPLWFFVDDFHSTPQRRRFRLTGRWRES